LQQVRLRQPTKNRSLSICQLKWPQLLKFRNHTDSLNNSSNLRSQD